MTSAILKRILENIDKRSLVQLGKNVDGMKDYPAIILDDCISWMGLSYLKYINTEEKCWFCMLVTHYGTCKTQIHGYVKQQRLFQVQTR